MANINKSYAVMNLSYRDADREKDYYLERVSGGTKFNLPPNMKVTHKMYASELTEIINQNTLVELETDTYTRNEVDNKLQDLEMDIQRAANDVFKINENSNTNQSIPVNNTRLVFNLFNKNE